MPTITDDTVNMGLALFKRLQEGTGTVAEELPTPSEVPDSRGDRLRRYIFDQVRQGIIPDEALAEIKRNPTGLRALMAYGEGALAAGTLLSGGGGKAPRGEPVTVYHGTRAAERLDPEYLGLGTGAQSAKQAFFFTKDRVLAQDYADMAMPMEALEARRAVVNAEKGQEQLHKDILTAPESEYDAMSARYSEFQKIIDENKPIIAEHQVARGRREELGGLHGDKDARVIEQQVNLQNPYVMDFKGAEFREQTYNDILKQAKEAGHDGVIFKNTHDPASSYRESRPTDIYAVFPEYFQQHRRGTAMVMRGYSPTHAMNMR